MRDSVLAEAEVSGKSVSKVMARLMKVTVSGAAFPSKAWPASTPGY